MATLSQQIPSHVSVEMVEVVAARRALMFVMELGFNKVEVEGDSESVVNAILGDYMDNSYMGHVLQDIKFMFSSFLLFLLSILTKKEIVLPINLLEGLPIILFLFRWSLFLQIFLMSISLIFEGCNNTIVTLVGFLPKKKNLFM